MLRNYFKTAWRNILRNKLYSGITVVGLTIGLAVGMLILLWVQDETSFDAFHHKAASIYRVNTPIGSGSARKVWGTTPGAVGAVAKRAVPGVVNAVRILTDYDYSVYSYGDKPFDKVEAVFVDSTLLQVFDLVLLAGDVHRLWPDHRSVLITASTAKRYFGHDDPVGKVILGDHHDAFTVSGVLADLPDNSSIHADLFFPMTMMARRYSGKDFWTSLDADWGNFGYTTYLEIQPGVSPEGIGRQLLAAQMRQAPQIPVSLSENVFELQPLRTVHLRQADGSAPGLQTVRIFGFVGILILLIASINYVNLSTARAMLRAKEVGVRKIIGAARKQLFAQFVVESVLFYGLALVFAFILMALLMPSYNALAGKHFRFDLTDSRIWGVVAVTGTGVLLASALYPALLLSSFRPLLALKGLVSRNVGNVLFRKVLVTVQFVFSVGLIIGTLVISRQLAYIREKDPGYDRQQVFSFRGRELRSHAPAVLAELRREPAITDVATASNNLVDNGNTTGDVDWDGKPVNSPFVVYKLGVDQRFLPMMKMSLAAGTNFNGGVADSAHFILNETAVRMTGIRDPVGKPFTLNDVRGTIIGVVKDFNFASLRERIEPAVLYYAAANNLYYVKTSGREAAKAIAAARRLWERYNPGLPFDYSFLDQRYESLYRSDLRTGSLFALFAGIAIFLSCLGLFGLATYTAQVRTREIGIRKVLGASVAGIVVLLSRDFLQLIVIAIVIAGPLAGWGMYRWLQDFVYRISIGVWVFVLAGAAALMLALLTIGWQAVRAALANPVRSLRSE